MINDDDMDFNCRMFRFHRIGIELLVNKSLFSPYLSLKTFLKFQMDNFLKRDNTYVLTSVFLKLTQLIL